jgi:hypothetical protein
METKEEDMSIIPSLNMVDVLDHSFNSFDYQVLEERNPETQYNIPGPPPYADWQVFSQVENPVTDNYIGCWSNALAWNGLGGQGAWDLWAEMELAALAPSVSAGNGMWDGFWDMPFSNAY